MLGLKKLFTAINKRSYPPKISMRRVYVLPRRHGYMVGLGVIGIFAIAIRIENNMLLLITVVLFVLFVLSLVWGGRNLAGISLKLQAGQRLIAGQAQEVLIQVHSGRPRHFLLFCDGTAKRRLNLTSVMTPVKVMTRIDQRGRVAMPPILLESDFPFGLARCWARVSAGEILVAPRPSLAEASSMQGGRGISSGGEGEAISGADSLKDWVQGSPQTRIHWKRFAASDRLLVKAGDEPQSDQLIINYKSFESLGHEEALSAMCGAILKASARQAGFVMVLPDAVIKTANGQAGEALDALALC